VSFRGELAGAERPQDLATLRTTGVSRGSLAGPGWTRVAPSMHRRTITGELSTTQRILDAAASLPDGGAIGGWAAAYPLGADWLDGRDDRTMATLPILLCVGERVCRRAPNGVVYSRAPLSNSEVISVRGVRLTHPVRTAFDGARRADSLEEAIVFLDILLAYGLIDKSAVERDLHRRSRWSGVRQVRQAVGSARVGIRSPWESRLRFLWHFDAGLPMPLINVPVFDPRGRLLGIPDLFDPEAGLVAEFDGAGHRDRGQHRKDNVREELFEEHNLTVVRADSLDLSRHRVETAARLRSGHRRATARNRSRDNWTLDHHLR
jgi:hypothetical protein